MMQSEQIRIISAIAKITKAQAGRALKAMRAIITDGLVDDGRVPFAGVGVFTVRDRKPRLTTITMGPKKGQKVSTPARKGIHFRPANSFKKAVNP